MSAFADTQRLIPSLSGTTGDIIGFGVRDIIPQMAGGENIKSQRRELCPECPAYLFSAHTEEIVE